jgi:hypothetical protein
MSNERAPIASFIAQLSKPASKPTENHAKRTASSTTQWIYSPVSRGSLPKTGIFEGAAGDFEGFSPQKFGH